MPIISVSGSPTAAVQVAVGGPQFQFVFGVTATAGAERGYNRETEADAEKKRGDLFHFCFSLLNSVGEHTAHFPVHGGPTKKCANRSRRTENANPDCRSAIPYRQERFRVRIRDLYRIKIRT